MTFKAPAVSAPPNPFAAASALSSPHAATAVAAASSSSRRNSASSSRRNSETHATAAPGDAVRALHASHTSHTSHTSTHLNNHPFSHTGFPNPVHGPGLAALDHGLGALDHGHLRLQWRAGARSSVFQHKVKASLHASGRHVVRSSGHATQNIKRLFPRSYNRTHISKWLIAENSGKSLEELDLLVGKKQTF